MLSLLQKHTVELYDLEKENFQKLRVDAVSLLKVQRFDLFAKLFYIKYRESNPEIALKIYAEHIKAFNPDLKEPGRTDKNSLEDFLRAFDELIDRFKDYDFDESISLVPVSKDDVILDASHRIAALAFFNKKVTILKFKEIQAITNFDYIYFQKRGLPYAIADTIAASALEYLDNVCIACYYLPEEEAMNYYKESLALHFQILYIRRRRLTKNGIRKFANLLPAKETSGINHFQVDNRQSVNLQIVLFEAESENEIQSFANEYYKRDKDTNLSYYISRNKSDVRDIVDLFFTEQVNSLTNSYTRSLDRLEEYKDLFENVHLIRYKTLIARYLNKVGNIKK